MGEGEAPGALELVRSFANTLDVEADRDAIATAGGLARWLDGAGLLTRDAGTPTPQELALARRARDGLRALMAATSHRDADLEAIEALDGVAEAAGMALRFGPGTTRLVPRTGGIAGALGRLLAITAEATADGTWQRLKLCAAETCAEAFYDRSRNRAGRWCSMEVCGNRQKVRAYRARGSDASA